MRVLPTVVLVAAVLTTAGCGDDGGGGGADRPDRPSASELAESLGTLTDADGGDPLYSETQARCIAGVLAGSDLSGTSLRTIAEDPAGFSPAGEEAEEFSRIAVRISTCLIDELATP